MKENDRTWDANGQKVTGNFATASLHRTLLEEENENAKRMING